MQNMYAYTFFLVVFESILAVVSDSFAESLWSGSPSYPSGTYSRFAAARAVWRA